MNQPGEIAAHKEAQVLLSPRLWIFRVWGWGGAWAGGWGTPFSAPSGAFIGKLKTVVLSGFITSGSFGMPSAFINSVNGSLLSARTVRM